MSMTSKFVGKDWNITLPTGDSSTKKPKVVEFPALETYSDENYKIEEDGIRMITPCNGFTTPNSSYPRCEFRELIGGAKAAWDGTKGVHELKYRFKVLRIPKKKPDVCIGQIHDAKDDLVEVRVEGTKLVARGKLFTGFVVIDDAFELNKEYTMSLGSKNGDIFCIKEGLTINLRFAKIKSKECYFKVGNYVQSNASKGDGGESSEVFLFEAKCLHGEITSPTKEEPSTPKEELGEKRGCCCCCTANPAKKKSKS